MKLSIIIPYYNGMDKIKPCLESIISQNLNPNDYEIIIVDDCSPQRCLKEDIVAMLPPQDNVLVIRLLENRRQGGARNEGIIHAKGEWIAFIDQDDYWERDTVYKIIESIDNAHNIPDMVMVDHCYQRGKQIFKRQYVNNTSTVYSGIEFIKNEELTWAPWGYFYRRKFLIENELKYTENVRFEDAEFAIRCVSSAKSIYYLPISLVHYTTNIDSTTAINLTSEDIVSQMLQHDWRVYQEYLRIAIINVDAGIVIKSHALAAFKFGSYRFIWLRYREIYSLTHKYFKGKFNKEDGVYLHSISLFPTMYSVIVSLVSPLLRYIVRCKQKRYLK